MQSSDVSSDRAGDPASANASSADIVITGIRASLARALDIKRETLGVVDAISAQDIGKFPDQNVAESLARVPGVSVSRTAGEGNFVTVRGFGPDFNTVLLNGRIVATDGNARAFDFSILPSELVSTLEVYKTSEARFQDGGIGSTINVRTARPLDHRGFFAAGQIGGRWDSKTKDTTPTGSALISQSNADGTFGALVSFAYDKRNAQVDRLSTDGWLNANLDYNKDGVVDAANVRMNRTLVQQVQRTERERIGGTLAIDWLPTDTLTLRVDGLYTQYKVKDRENFFGLFSDPADIISATINANGTVTDYVRNNTGSLANDQIVTFSPRNSKVYQGGLNAEWKPDDRTTITADLSYSGASSDTYGDSGFFVIGSRNTGLNPEFHLNEGGLPYMTGIRSSTDTSDLYAHVALLQGSKVTDDLGQFQLDAKREFNGMLKRITVGGLASQRTKSVFDSRTPTGIVEFYPGYFATVPSSLMSVFSSGSSSFLGSQNLPGQWLSYDPSAFISYLTSDAAITQKNDADAEANYRSLLANNSGGYQAVPQPLGTSAVRERSLSAYTQVDFGGDAGAMPWKLQVGLRYTHTNLRSTGSSQTLTSITGKPGDATGVIYFLSPALPREVKNSYGFFLPSVTGQISFTDNLVGRAAVSRTLTRPALNQLSVAQSYNIRLPGTFQVNGNNPELKPYLSWNFDAGLDYYFSRVNYISVAGFYRKIENFVSTATIPVTILGFPFLSTQPINANKGGVYGVEGTIQYGFSFLPAPFDGLGVSANYTKVKSTVQFDPSLSSASFNLPGLSDSANASLFYEKGPVQLRAAYNWRAGFLQTAFGAEGQPENRTAYGQLDFTASVALNDHFSLYGEVLNALNERTLTYQQYRERFLNTEETGTRVTIGARARF